MDDEHLFLEANNEIEAGNKKQALWIKALALVGGDEKKAKHQYILLRVEQLRQDKESIESEGNIQPGGQGVYKSLYFASFVIGILLVSYIYLLNFDNFSETMLIHITPLWFFPMMSYI